MMTVQPVSLAADPLAARQMPASRRFRLAFQSTQNESPRQRATEPRKEAEAQCTAVTYKASIYIYTCCARSRSLFTACRAHGLVRLLPATCRPTKGEYAKTAHLLLRMRQQRPSSLLALGPQTDQSTQCIILRVEVHRMQKVRDLLRQGRRREYPPTTRTAPALTSFRGPRTVLLTGSVSGFSLLFLSHIHTYNRHSSCSAMAAIVAGISIASLRPLPSRQRVNGSVPLVKRVTRNHPSFASVLSAPSADAPRAPVDQRSRPIQIEALTRFS